MYPDLMTLHLLRIQTPTTTCHSWTVYRCWVYGFCSGGVRSQAEAVSFWLDRLAVWTLPTLPSSPYSSVEDGEPSQHRPWFDPCPCFFPPQTSTTDKPTVPKVAVAAPVKVLDQVRAGRVKRS